MFVCTTGENAGAVCTTYLPTHLQRKRRRNIYLRDTGKYPWKVSYRLSDRGGTVEPCLHTNTLDRCGKGVNISPDRLVASRAADGQKLSIQKKTANDSNRSKSPKWDAWIAAAYSRCTSELAPSVITKRNREASKGDAMRWLSKPKHGTTKYSPLLSMLSFPPMSWKGGGGE